MSTDSQSITHSLTHSLDFLVACCDSSEASALGSSHEQRGERKAQAYHCMHLWGLPASRTASWTLRAGLNTTPLIPSQWRRSDTRTGWNAQIADEIQWRRHMDVNRGATE